MADAILDGFLSNSHNAAMALALDSDRVKLLPAAGDPPRKFVAEFNCRGLVREDSGDIVLAEKFVVGIFFSSDYLRGKPDGLQVVTLLSPPNLWHPNVRWPYMCLGNLRPGTDLVSLLYQTYEVLTWQKWAAHDGLNPAACEWARNVDPGHFPTDRRPLRRRTLEVEEITAGGKP